MRLVAILYKLLRPYRAYLLAGSVLLVAVCSFTTSRLVVKEDVTSLMPTRPESLAGQFFLLREAPFTQGLTITVSGENPARLAETLAASLRGEVVPRVFGGAAASFSPEMLTSLCAASPGLMEPEQLASLPEMLADEAVRRSLARDARLLQTPKGLALRDLLAMDPLGICGKTLHRLAPKSGTGPRLESGHLVSADGKHALLFAEPAAPIGDSAASREIMAAARAAVEKLPPGAEALIVGGHRHTEENAGVIMADVKRIMPVSLLLLALAYLIFVRTCQGLGIVLLPGAALAVASAGAGLIGGTLSGIVIGFGSVILGITADYAIHVYFALRTGTDAARSLKRVGRPLLVGAGTTLAAFAAFLFSDIPCIAQMAVFSICGIIAAVLLALFVLPQFLTARQGKRSRPKETEPAFTARRVPLIAVWTALLALLAVLFHGLPVDGDVRALSYTSKSIIADEARTREIWGNLREGAMLAVRGENLEKALEKNDAVWETLGEASQKGGFDRAVVTGLGGILPAASTQEKRHAAWKNFWRENGPDAVARLEAHGSEAGFAADAFAPFAAWIAAKPAFLTAEKLEDIGLSLPLQLARETEKGSIVYNLLPADTPPALLADLAGKGAAFVSGQTFREALSGATRSDMVRFGGISLLAVALMVAATLRSPWRVALALLPVAAGLGAVLGVFRGFGLSLNMFHAMALPLVMALSVDYGVFMLARMEGALDEASRKGVFLSGLTTLTGFGALLLANHPALFSLGLTVVLGLTAALCAALCLLPLLAAREAPRG